MRTLSFLLLLAACSAADDTDTDTDSDTDADTDADTDSDTDTDPGPDVPHALGLCDVLDSHAARNVDDIDAELWSLDEAVDLGIELVRPHRPRGHVFSMSMVDPEEDGVYDWSLTDHVVEEAGDRGLHLLITVYTVSDPRPKDESPPGLIPVFPPEDTAAWEAFVTAMVERYDGDGESDMPSLLIPVYAWEFGNEPPCNPDETLCHQAFFDVVSTGYEATHTADPDAIVLPGGPAPIWRPFGQDELNPGPAATYDAFVTMGGLDYADAFSFHYPTGSTNMSVTSHLDYWRELVGPDMELWLSETASRSVDDDVIVSPDPDDEAQWVEDHLDEAFAAGATRVFWCLTADTLTRAPLVYDVLQARAAELSE